MRVPGAIYTDKKGKDYVALYTFWPDIYTAAPPSIKKAKRIIHLSYVYEGQNHAIEAFSCNKLPHHHTLANEVDIKRNLMECHLKPDYVKNLERIDAKHNICAEVVRGYENVMTLMRADIGKFARKPARIQGQNLITSVNEIVPKTKIRKIYRKHLVTSGKSSFEPSCGLEANLDFSGGCISTCMGGSTEGDYVIEGLLDVFAECAYCYADYQHKTFWKTMIEFTKEQLKDELMGNCHLEYDSPLKHGRPIKILRLGKTTETGSKFTRDSLMKTLETCIETGTRVVMPTKYLEYDNDVADLLKKTNSSLLYSIGWDELERGPCMHGCDNEFRLEQAVKYREAGVNSNIYLLIDLPHPPSNREHDVLDFAEKNNIPVQLLPIRIQNKETAQFITGMTWDELRKPSSDPQGYMNGIVKKSRGGYLKLGAGNGRLVAQEKDPFWLNIVGNNKGDVRMCHHDQTETYCGNCFLHDGFVRPADCRKINYDRTKRRNFRRKPRELSEHLFKK